MASRTLVDMVNDIGGVNADKLQGYTPEYFRGFKNLIINGGFKVWQRGTSYSYGGNTYGYHTADRIYSGNSADGQFTVSKSEINGENAIKINADIAVSDLTADRTWATVGYLFEGQHLYSIAKQGKTVTLSFIFNSNVTGKFPVSLRNRTNDGSGNVQSYVTTFEYTTANVPKKIEVQIPLNTNWNPELQNDNNRGFQLSICYLNQESYVVDTTDQWINGNYLTTSDCVNWGANEGNFFEIADLQLEVGEKATQFEDIPYDIELLRCMRYYEIQDFGGGASYNCDGTYVWKGAYSINFSNVKRNIPSVLLIEVDSNSSYTIDNLTQRGVRIYVDHPDTNSYYYYWKELIVDAEL